MASLAFSRLSQLASANGLSVYDAAYLVLAQRRKLPLGCKMVIGAASGLIAIVITSRLFECRLMRRGD